MTDSVCTESVVVGGEAAAWLVDEPVVPAADGEGEDALADAHPDALEGVCAVALEREVALERVGDRFDPLAHAPERAKARLLVAAVGPDELGVERGDEALELLVREALVADDEVAAPDELAAAGALQHGRDELSLRVVRGREREGDRQPVRGAEQVEAKAPDEACSACWP
jgi:hypothetical protein